MFFMLAGIAVSFMVASAFRAKLQRLRYDFREDFPRQQI